jgi:hypothetical protein
LRLAKRAKRRAKVDNAFRILTGRKRRQDAIEERKKQSLLGLDFAELPNVAISLPSNAASALTEALSVMSQGVVDLGAEVERGVTASLNEAQTMFEASVIQGSEAMKHFEKELEYILRELGDGVVCEVRCVDKKPVDLTIGLKPIDTIAADRGEGTLSMINSKSNVNGKGIGMEIFGYKVCSGNREAIATRAAALGALWARRGARREIKVIK